MANTIITTITIESTKEAIDFFEKEMNEIYSNPRDQRNKLFENKFASEGDNNIKRFGSKWISLTNDKERSNDEEYIFQIESANYHPDILITNIRKKLDEVSGEGNTVITGRFWEESYSEIGIFEDNRSGHHTAEKKLDIDSDFESYWEMIDEEFENLEL